MLPDTQAREGAAASLSPHPATTFSDEVNVFVAKHQRVLLLGAPHRLEHEAHSRLRNVRRKAALVWKRRVKANSSSPRSRNALMASSTACSPYCEQNGASFHVAGWDGALVKL